MAEAFAPAQQNLSYDYYYYHYYYYTTCVVYCILQLYEKCKQFFDVATAIVTITAATTTAKNAGGAWQEHMTMDAPANIPTPKITSHTNTTNHTKNTSNIGYY